MAQRNMLNHAPFDFGLGGAHSGKDAPMRATSQPAGTAPRGEFDRGAPQPHSHSGPPSNSPPSNPQPSGPQPGTPRPRRSRSWFWPGFIGGFLFLMLVSLGGLAMLAGVTPLALSDLQNPGIGWTPPPVPPTPEVVEQPVAAQGEPVDQSTPAGYAVGDRLRNITSSRVNIRRVPGYLSKPDGDVVAQIGPGEEIELLGGRATADNLTWWYIRHTSPANQVTEGWIAEATASGVQILGR